MDILHEKSRLYHNDLPIKQVFKIHSITVVIKSLIEKNNKFYLEFSTNHCLYKVVSKKWKINDTTYKYICGYLNNDTIQPLCVILPQMDGYIKYFDDGGKNISFVTDDEEICEKYNEIWEVIRKLLKVDFTVGPIRDDKYLVAKLKIFDRINRTTFTNNVIPI